jgi:hypothetical protein
MTTPCGSTLAARALFALLLMSIAAALTYAQVENVPVANQVYEFLNRMGVKGILPLYSNAMIPISRQEVAADLIRVENHSAELTSAENAFLQKFLREFMHEIDPARVDDAVLFRGGLAEVFSDKEKYVYTDGDSTASLYLEFLASLEHRRASGDSYPSAHTSFEQHGGRVRGTLKGRLGYYLQATNGTLYGDRAFALSDTRLRGNVKFNDLNSPYVDFTEAYLRADLGWFNLEFGREYTLVGTGYSDRLLLSDNAPVMDFLKLDAQYKSLKFLFLQASLTADPTLFPGIPVLEPPGSNKYLALHRLQVSLFDRLNLGCSEMIIYQRFSPEFAYLNPVNFYKSSEHSLRDRDNAFLNLDVELFPAKNMKVYGTWLIDDIDFSKMGTGWWGNEFGWQGGVFLAELAGLHDLDAIAEYTRIEPYVYSNRISGNDFTNNGIGLGHHLPPNSDEWFLQLQYRPLHKFRAWLTYTRTRHGDNVMANGLVIQNVGGDALQGHRDTDSETALFLDGVVTRTHALQLRAAYEVVTNLILNAAYEYRNSTSPFVSSVDHYGTLRLQLEY